MHCSSNLQSAAITIAPTFATNSAVTTFAAAQSSSATRRGHMLQQLAPASDWNKCDLLHRQLRRNLYARKRWVFHFILSKLVLDNYSEWNPVVDCPRRSKCLVSWTNNDLSDSQCLPDIYKPALLFSEPGIKSVASDPMGWRCGWKCQHQNKLFIAAAVAASASAAVTPALSGAANV